MSKRVHDCMSCDGKTRHDNPAKCSKCRAFDRALVETRADYREALDRLGA